MAREDGGGALYLARHQEVLEREPVQKTQRGAKAAAAWYSRLPPHVKLIVTLLTLVVFVAVIPFFLFAAYYSWREPKYRERVYHGFAVFLLGLVAFLLLTFSG